MLLRTNISNFWEGKYFFERGKDFQERNLGFDTYSNFLNPSSLKPDGFRFSNFHFGNSLIKTGKYLNEKF